MWKGGWKWLWESHLKWIKLCYLSLPGKKQWNQNTLKYVKLVLKSYFFTRKLLLNHLQTICKVSRRKKQFCDRRRALCWEHFMFLSTLFSGLLYQFAKIPISQYDWTKTQKCVLLCQSLILAYRRPKVCSCNNLCNRIQVLIFLENP